MVLSDKKTIGNSAFNSSGKQNSNLISSYINDNTLFKGLGNNVTKDSPAFKRNFEKHFSNSSRIANAIAKQAESK